MRPIDADELLKHAIVFEDSLIHKRWVDEFIINRMPTLNVKPIRHGKWISAEVFDKIRAEIEHMIPCSKEALSMKLGVLEIIDKYKAESEDKNAISN